MTEPIPDQTESLDPGAQRFLSRLASVPAVVDLYLAGSAALAAYLGHRSVRNLDIMGYNRLTSPDRRDLLQALLAIDEGIRVETARDGYLYVRLPEDWGGGAVRFFYYPYPLVEPEQELEGVAVASLADLGAMKMGAIISRGSRRDFVDLFLLCRRLPLEGLAHRAAEKFGHVRDFPLQAFKGLADRSQALEEPMPHSSQRVDWAEVEAWLDGPVRELARSWVGLDSRSAV